MSSIQSLNEAYGFTQALLNIFPQPIIALRAPTTRDKAQLGTTWINKSAGVAYVLTQIVNNAATWQALAGGNTFNNLTVTPGPISLTGTTTINTAGAATTTIGTGGTGVVNIGNATGNTSITGTLTTSSTINVASGGMVVNGTTAINVATAQNTGIGTAGTGAVSIGNVTGGILLTGAVGVTNGDVTLNSAGSAFTLPGPVNIISGAGAPANGLALHVGDFYINTTAASAATRVYVATGVGAWTNLTAAA
jgi:hypothetical protein